jgi:hypothetical protein
MEAFRKCVIGEACKYQRLACGVTGMNSRNAMTKYPDLLLDYFFGHVHAYRSTAKTAKKEERRIEAAKKAAAMQELIDEIWEKQQTMQLLRKENNRFTDES